MHLSSMFTSSQPIDIVVGGNARKHNHGHGKARLDSLWYYDYHNKHIAYMYVVQFNFPEHYIFYKVARLVAKLGQIVLMF